ncbi:substrate-binding domain-containing protein [Yoonia sp. SS1-5]|uniref:PstS family phosphate ABC transporter substrate-binding protein n=1 Tax=Yoonia rhodophyticola TaxID=3137370 RepID=A0AAN0NM59_9RHOB
MLKKIATALLCTAAPAALLAEPVDLRSDDGLISVVGEILAFDGTILTVETSVGPVGVPAAVVSCYGTNCLTALADASLGLSPSTFQNIYIAGAAIEILDSGDDTADTDNSSEATNAAVAAAIANEPAPQAPGELRDDQMTISFETAENAALFNAVAAGFAVASDTSGSLSLSTPGQIGLSNPSLNQTASLTIGDEGGDGDIEIVTVSTHGLSTPEYSGPGDWALTGPLSHQLLALKAFAVVMSPDVGLPAISVDDLAAIYAGEITNWSELGGPDLRILPLQLPADAQLRREMIRIVMEPAGKSIADTVLTMADEASIATSVGQFPGSVSILALENAQPDATVPVAGTCGVPVDPTAFNIVSGDYPLIRPVMARFDRAPTTGLMTELFDFASDAAATEQVTAAGFLDRTGVFEDQDINNARVSNILTSALDDAAKPAAGQMFEVLFDADRLSHTMIGGAASGPEGGWNRAMFRNLADTLSLPAYEGREIIFVGLGTSENGAQAAVEVSNRAALEMQAAFGQFAADVIADNNLTFSAYGFGPVAQVACYEGQITSETDTRVEVWVR